MMIRLLLLLVALAFSGVAKAQRELTIYENASERNVAIPVMFASFKNYARTQFIIPASELSAMAGEKSMSSSFILTVKKPIPRPVLSIFT